MSLTKTIATTLRVLRQLRYDPRTIVLMLAVPCLLMWLLSYIFNQQVQVFNNIAPILLGIFPLLLMFMVASIVTLRERTTGTMDRLMTMPVGKLDIIVGYALAFALIGVIQAILVGWVSVGLLDVPIAGPFWALLVAAIAAAILGTSMGLFVSAFSQTEFQAVQLVVPILIPQILLCGLFIPVAALNDTLQTISKCLPLTYSVKAMQEVASQSTWTSELTKDITIVLLFGLAFLLIASLTIRRQE